MIFNDIRKFKEYFDTNHGSDTVMYATSGGFDPMHIGHLRCLQATANLSIRSGAGSVVVVIVNGDGFLERKKGKPFMCLAERMEIIDGIRGIDYVVSWDDLTQNVKGALRILKPHVFTKGGDRTSELNVPESDLCKEIGCRIIFGVGGGKIQSSSNLISNSDKASQIFDLSPEIWGTGSSWLCNNSRKIEKPWGTEEIIVHSDKYVGKIITIYSGQKLSRQYHQVKDETIICLSGLCEVEIGGAPVPASFLLKKGESQRITPGMIHRFKNNVDNNKDKPVQLLEISTPELDDVVRLEDDYSRA